MISKHKKQSKHSRCGHSKHSPRRRDVLVDCFHLPITTAYYVPLLLATQVIDGGCDAYFKAFPDSKAAKRG